MLDKFEDYLGKLPLTQVIRTRIEEVIKLNMKIREFDFQDIFICELKNQEGSRSYTSLWLFTDAYTIECKNFLTQTDFDIVPHIKKIGYCSTSSKDFDFENANDKSSINIHITFSVGSGGGVTGDIIATEQNCISALEIYKKYFVNNLVE